MYFAFPIDRANALVEEGGPYVNPNPSLNPNPNPAGGRGREGGWWRKWVLVVFFFFWFMKAAVIPVASMDANDSAMDNFPSGGVEEEERSI